MSNVIESEKKEVPKEAVTKLKDDLHKMLYDFGKQYNCSTVITFYDCESPKDMFRVIAVKN